MPPSPSTTNSPHPPTPLPTLSTPTSFTLGTGASIYSSTLLPALQSTTHELILTTCFWAPSPTLSSLSSALLSLSARSLSLTTQDPTRGRIRVYICLSSRSLAQKLSHTRSRTGHVYPPDAWKRKLGLPAPDEVPGLKLVVKSLFFAPLGALHAKYVLVDRRAVYLPSCNVSWEEWVECCVGFSGAVVGEVFGFWKGVWMEGEGEEAGISESLPEGPAAAAADFRGPAAHTLAFPQRGLQTTLLPHLPPHTLSLSIPSPFPLPLLLPSLHPSPPATPLNCTILHLLSTATKSITLLTPNLTSLPVHTALLSALRRGVDVRVVTNRRMMVLEQLLTAGSVTECWVWAVVRAHRRMFRAVREREQKGRWRRGEAGLLEEGRAGEGRGLNREERGIGGLRVGYFRPFPPSAAVGGAGAEAVKTHVKLTVVDGELLVLGSGNMDRASWFTSQELGVMVREREVVGRIWGAVEESLEGRVEVVYNS